MFTLHSGPFHPYLETRLVETVQRLKAADSCAPLTIVAPSESLRRRLQWVFGVEHHCALFDVHFLSFHQLALRLDAERCRRVEEASLPSLEMVGDFFYEYLLSAILQEDVSSFTADLRGNQTSGFSSALWRTIRDFQEAQVDPDVVHRGIEEHLFAQDAAERLRGLAELQAKLQAWTKQLGVGLPDDLTQSVISWVGHSSFLARQSQVLYYGFYDLTQVQLSLLEEIARVTTVTVFFPLADAEAFRFARRFVDRHLLKAGVVRQSPPETEGTVSPKAGQAWMPTRQIVSAAGPEGELIFTAKTIRRLVDQHGYAWHEIGVTARDLTPYLVSLPRMCKAYWIPYWTTATRPMLEEPWAKIWWLLAGLREKHLPWRGVVDVVMSPWYRCSSMSQQSPHDRSHLWIQALRYFRIVGGVDDWERLVHVAYDPASVEEWHTTTDVSLTEATGSLQVLANRVAALVRDCQALPVEGSVGELTQAYEMLVRKHVDFGENTPPVSSSDYFDDSSRSPSEEFQQIIESLQQLDRIPRRVTWEQWLAVCHAALEQARIPLPDQAPMGVQVLDVMAARGRPFKALFVLGMNDHVFPRIIREDAFLRDRERKVLAESLGYKIDEKLSGFDEEMLLFALLESSVRDHLYLIYQRADQHARPLVPSSLLRNGQHTAAVMGAIKEVRVPVGLLERSKILMPTWGDDSPGELRLCKLLEGHFLEEIKGETSAWWEIFQNGMRAIQQIERGNSSAGPFDGLLDVRDGYWQDLLDRGLSPTAIGLFAQCPMRYWMRHVLHAKESHDPIAHEISSRVWGDLVHEILRIVYQDLSRHGWPQQTLSRAQLSDILAVHATRVFQQYSQRFGTDYWLVWTWAKARLIDMMFNMIARDQRDFLEHHLIPSAYEVDATGMFSYGTPEQPETLNIVGRFDRVDQSVDHDVVRIVDYKVSMRRSFQTHDEDLIHQALQGRQLQPPFYSMMLPQDSQSTGSDGESSTSSGQSVEFRFLRPLSKCVVSTATFPGTIWDTSIGQQLRQTMQRWVRGIQEGNFFILPGSYCRTCSYAVACRVRHHPSWLRAYRFPLARSYRFIQKQKVSNDSSL